MAGWYKALESKVKAIRSAPKELGYEREERLAKESAEAEKKKKKALSWSPVTANTRMKRMMGEDE